VQELFTLYTRLSSFVNNILFLIFWYVRVQSNTILYSSCFNILYVCIEKNHMHFYRNANKSVKENQRDNQETLASVQRFLIT
jgi:hypothetical protein